MAMHLISKTDKVAMFDYLTDYEHIIKKNFGKYNLQDITLQKFLTDNSIYLGGLNKDNKLDSRNFSNYILFEQNKPPHSPNDEAHHLLRHCRNAIAHGKIKKIDSSTLSIKDNFITGMQSISMEGRIRCKLFLKLLNHLIQTRI